MKEKECNDQREQAAREGLEVGNELQEQTQVLVQEQCQCFECFSGPRENKGGLHEVDKEEGGGADSVATSFAVEGALKAGGIRKEKQLERSLGELEEDEDLVEWLQGGNLPTEALDLLNAYMEWQYCTCGSPFY